MSLSNKSGAIQPQRRPLSYPASFERAKVQDASTHPLADLLNAQRSASDASIGLGEDIEVSQPAFLSFDNQLLLKRILESPQDILVFDTEIDLWSDFELGVELETLDDVINVVSAVHTSYHNPCPLQAAGIGLGDVILSVNYRVCKNKTHLVEALEAAWNEESDSPRSADGEESSSSMPSRSGGPGSSQNGTQSDRRPISRNSGSSSGLNHEWTRKCIPIQVWRSNEICKRQPPGYFLRHG